MSRKTLLLALGLALLTTLSALPVSAEQPKPELVLIFQPKASVGEEIAVKTHLLDPAGKPIRGEIVTFFIDVEFMNVLDRVEIGKAETDSEGLALLMYTPRIEGERTVIARFAGNEVFAPAQASNPLLIMPGPAIYVEERPFRMPGANINLVVGVLSVVWGLYLLVMVLFWRISRARTAAGTGEEPRL